MVKFKWMLLGSRCWVLLRYFAEVNSSSEGTRVLHRKYSTILIVQSWLVTHGPPLIGPLMGHSWATDPSPPPCSSKFWAGLSSLPSVIWLLFATEWINKWKLIFKKEHLLRLLISDEPGAYVRDVPVMVKLWNSHFHSDNSVCMLTCLLILSGWKIEISPMTEGQFPKLPRDLASPFSLSLFLSVSHTYIHLHPIFPLKISEQWLFPFCHLEGLRGRVT